MIIKLLTHLSILRNTAFVVIFLISIKSYAQPYKYAQIHKIPLDSIPIGFTASSQLVVFANQVLRSYDQITIPVQQKSLAYQITAPRKVIINPSLGTAISWPDSMFNQINTFGYDFEHWPYTPDSEQADPTIASQEAQNFARMHGLTYNLGPDLQYASTAGPQMAVYADGFTLQLQKLQHDPKLFSDTLKALSSRIRSSNPDIKIWVQIGAQVSGVNRSVTEMLIAADSASNYADGIDIFYGTAVDTLKQFIYALRGTTARVISGGINQPISSTLLQNYPNPFNLETEIDFNLAANSFVTLKVFDLMGKEVKTLMKGNKQAGYYTYHFDATGLASGIYYYRLTASGFAQSKKFILLK
jgi:hypothetical protein